jgi:hypothetical protein
MWDGHAMAQTGRAEALAGKQTVCDQGAVHPVLILEQQAGFFKSALFTGRFDTNQYLGEGQNLRKTVHNNLLIGELCTSRTGCRKKRAEKSRLKAQAAAANAD